MAGRHKNDTVDLGGKYEPEVRHLPSQHLCLLCDSMTKEGTILWNGSQVGWQLCIQAWRGGGAHA